MYAGSTLTAASGRLAGAHQKIDRTARRHLQALLRDTMPHMTDAAIKSSFPNIGKILHFEGRNGPDGIKRKSPAKDEPWHYFSPFDETDTLLIELIEGHYTNLVVALRKKDTVVASFEAAWLAHAVVDGLTPAHHYPYEEKLGELRGGRAKESRVTYKDKLVMPGRDGPDAVKNNWKMWGPKGLFTTHLTFEWGVASILLPMKLAPTKPTSKDISAMQSLSTADYFRWAAKEIAAFGMYDEYYRKGWTSALARNVRQRLVPVIIKAVTLIWYKAVCEASQTSTKPGKQR
jgi:hypothetical protein